MSHLILIRGLPGSGKSTLAEKIASFSIPLPWDEKIFWVETDRFWEDRDFCSHLLPLAHAHTLVEAGTALSTPDTTVIVSNTFTVWSELYPYVELAKAFNIRPIIIECKNTFGSTKPIPQETLDRYATKWMELYESKDYIVISSDQFVS